MVSALWDFAELPANCNSFLEKRQLMSNCVVVNLKGWSLYSQLLKSIAHTASQIDKGKNQWQPDVIKQTWVIFSHAGLTKESSNFEDHNICSTFWDFSSMGNYSWKKNEDLRTGRSLSFSMKTICGTWSRPRGPGRLQLIPKRCPNWRQPIPMTKREQWFSTMTKKGQNILFLVTSSSLIGDNRAASHSAW